MSSSGSLPTTVFPNLSRYPETRPHLSCPDCSVPMEAFLFQNQVQDRSEILEKCPTCQGIWFKNHQLGNFRDSLLRFDLSKLQVLSKPEYERLEGLSKCPSCHRGLTSFHYSYNTRVTLERCDRCQGIWSPLKQTLSFIELAKMSQAIEPDVRALAREVDQMQKENKRWQDVSNTAKDFTRHVSPLGLSTGSSAQGIFLPLGAERFQAGTPWATYSLILGCCFTWTALRKLELPEGISPWQLTELANFYRLICNLIFLWVFGGAVELRFRTVLYVLFFLLIIFFVGVNGATCALLGAYLAMWPSGKIRFLTLIDTIRVPAWMFFSGWLFFTATFFAFSLNRGNDLSFWFHELLGTALGFAAASLFNRTDQRKTSSPSS